MDVDEKTMNVSHFEAMGVVAKERWIFVKNAGEKVVAVDSWRSVLDGKGDCLILLGLVLEYLRIYVGIYSECFCSFDIGVGE